MGCTVPVSCMEMCSPHNNENNRILTSSPLPVCSKHRPLLQCIPFLLCVVGYCHSSLSQACLNWRRLESRDVCSWKWSNSAGSRVTGRQSKSLPTVSRPQGWPLEKQEHERDVSKNGPPLPNTMRGIEERGMSRMAAGRRRCRTITAAGSFSVPRLTGFLFASGQLSGELIIVCVCSTEDCDEVQLHALLDGQEIDDIFVFAFMVCLLGLHPCSWLQLRSYLGISHFCHTVWKPPAWPLNTRRKKHCIWRVHSYKYHRLYK